MDNESTHSTLAPFTELCQDLLQTAGLLHVTLL